MIHWRDEIIHDANVASRNSTQNRSKEKLGKWKIVETEIERNEFVLASLSCHIRHPSISIYFYNFCVCVALLLLVLLLYRNQLIKITCSADTLNGIVQLLSWFVLVGKFVRLTTWVMLLFLWIQRTAELNWVNEVEAQNVCVHVFDEFRIESHHLT